MIIRREHLIAPVTCQESDTIIQVAQKLRDTNRRHLVVVDANEIPVGIISVTDLNNKIIAEQADPAKLRAEDVMTRNIMTVSTDEGYDKAFFLMERLNTTSIPIVEDGKLYGILEFSQSHRLRTLGNPLEEN